MTNGMRLAGGGYTELGPLLPENGAECGTEVGGRRKRFQAWLGLELLELLLSGGVGSGRLWADRSQALAGQ
jgi:hypothetical protein